MLQLRKSVRPESVRPESVRPRVSKGEKDFCKRLKIFDMAGRIPWALLVCLLHGLAGTANATQAHPPGEGVYAHQMGHVFFMLSMAILIYRLRRINLVKEPGWRFIQYSAFFFILWNLDTVVVHYLDGRHDLFETINTGAWSGVIHLVEGPRELAMLYYVGKMDHLLCLPAIVLLYLGLRRLLKSAQRGAPAMGEPRS